MTLFKICTVFDWKFSGTAGTESRDCINLITIVSYSEDEVPTVSTINTALLNLSRTQRIILKTVCRLLQLLLVLPGTCTNAT